MSLKKSIWLRIFGKIKFIVSKIILLEFDWKYEIKFEH